MSLERIKYLTFVENDLKMFTLRELVPLIKELDKETLWSGRFTGILGMPDCSSGNRGPKDEVLFAFGKSGLAFLIEMGFIPCPTCHPEDQANFWETVANPIETTYHLEDVHDFALLDFDARRVNWEFLLPYLKRTPGRLYIPKLAEEDEREELLELKERFFRLGFELPPVGYYDRDAPGHFFAYEIPK